MAFLPGIFNRNPAPAPAAQQQAAPQPAAPAPQVGGPASQQPAPANPAANPAAMQNLPAGTPAAGGPQAPDLSSYAAMFTPKAADPNAPQQPTLNDPILNPVDPAKFREQVANANFAASIPQETLQKAISGDVSAFQEAINAAAREAFAAATQLSQGLAEHASRTAAERALGQVDSKVRNHLLKVQNTSNEVLSNPAVSPVFNAVKAQIAQAQPHLSPDAVQKTAESYFTDMANALTAPQRQAEATKTAPKQNDFSYLLQ
jgi:hypothetical protein